MSRALSDIIEDIVNGLSRQVDIVDVQDNGDGTTSIELCELKYIEPGRTITIDGSSYVVQSIDGDTNTIIVTTGDPITAASFDLYPVYFFHGTILDTENQVRDVSNAASKTPMVFLLVPYTERFYRDINNPIERSSRFTLFFLTQANFDAWTTGDLMTNAVKPMDNLKDMFVSALQESGIFYTEELITEQTPRIKFGVYINNKGVQKAFQAMDLSGLQLDFPGLEIFEQDTVCACEPRTTGIGSMEIPTSFIVS